MIVGLGFESHPTWMLAVTASEQSQPLHNVGKSLEDGTATDKGFVTISGSKIF